MTQGIADFLGRSRLSHGCLISRPDTLDYAGSLQSIVSIRFSSTVRLQLLLEAGAWQATSMNSSDLRDGAVRSEG